MDPFQVAAFLGRLPMVYKRTTQKIERFWKFVRTILSRIMAQQPKEKKKEQEPNNNDEKWPDDAPDDEPESKSNDNGNSISIRIEPIAGDTNDANIRNIVLELTTPAKKRVPVDICAVLDVSGSTCSSAAVQEDDGSTKKDDGLSILDCVKHSVKTVMHCLDKNDRLSIVPFSSDAKIHHALSYMTQQGVQRATAALEQLQPGGQTNLWEGLRMGMNALRTKQEPGRLSVIMLLTDGRPTVSPKKGEIHELQKYLDQYDFAVQINTFGFGYDLDSELLCNLAVCGNGTFAFIPDSLIVGTTFVNSISNILTTISTETRLSLTAMNGAKFVGKSYGAHKEQDESWGRVVEFGPITAGNTRYISVPMQLPPADKDDTPYLEVLFTAAVPGNGVQALQRGKSQAITTLGTKRNLAPDLVAGHLTAKTVSMTMGAIDLFVSQNENAALKLLESIKNEVKVAADIASKSDTDDFNLMSANSRLEALNGDVNGRLAKAFTGEHRFNRWGKHYLRALSRAHQINLCTNFMDVGLKINGGDLFRTLRAKGDEVFINLPPPKPSRRTGPTLPVHQRGIQNAAPAYVAPAPQVDMRDYYGGGGGGCFAPFCCVDVMDMCAKQWVNTQVCDVRPGDRIKCADGCATVVYTVQLARDVRRRMVRFEGGLVITGGHPIRRNGVWCRARDVSDAQRSAGCDTVFTFVLDQSHIVLVNGVECVTLAHGMKDEIVRDDFYGTTQVIDALKRRLMEMRNKRSGEGRSRTLNVNGMDSNPMKNVIGIYQ
eukprot:249474_1